MAGMSASSQHSHVISLSQSILLLSDLFQHNIIIACEWPSKTLQGTKQLATLPRILRHSFFASTCNSVVEEQYREYSLQVLKLASPGQPSPLRTPGLNGTPNVDSRWRAEQAAASLPEPKKPITYANKARLPFLYLLSFEGLVSEDPSQDDILQFSGPLL